MWPFFQLNVKSPPVGGLLIQVYHPARAAWAQYEATAAGVGVGDRGTGGAASAAQKGQNRASYRINTNSPPTGGDLAFS